MTTAPAVLTPQEVADMFRVPLDTVYRWRTNGDGPRGYRIGRHTRYDLTDVLAFKAAAKAAG